MSAFYDWADSDDAPVCHPEHIALMEEAWNAAIKAANKIANDAAIAQIEHTGIGSASDRMAAVAYNIWQLREGDEHA